MIQKILLGEPASGDAELDQLFTSKKEMTRETIINASLG